MTAGTMLGGLLHVLQLSIMSSHALGFLYQVRQVSVRRF